MIDIFDLSRAISLPRYAKIIGYSECQFFGVSNSGDVSYSCRDIWTKRQRDDVADYLREAQDMIEDVAGYPLSPTWITDERHDYITPIIANMKKLICPGIQGKVCIESGVTIDYAEEPAIIGPILSTVTDPSEVHLFYPDEDQEIIPSNVSIFEGEITIKVPRCRLVAFDLQDNPPTGLEYTDDANFLTTIDIYRVYCDQSVQAVILARDVCCGNPPCGDNEYTACEHFRKPELGIMDIKLATYTDGVWSTSEQCVARCDVPYAIEINYEAGLTSLTRQAESAIVRLAHALMPTEPCGCDDTQRLWKRDRNEPAVLTAERINCPFGMSDGAWVAWRYASSLSLGSSSQLGATKV